MLNGDFRTAVLDSLTTHIAAVDKQWTILGINRAWLKFAADNGNPPLSAVGVGANYRDVLLRTQGQQKSEALAVWEGFQKVQCGAAALFTYEYPCHSPTERRWYCLRATALGNTGGIVVAHELTTERKLLEHRLYEATQTADLLRQQAQRANQAKDEFLANMSHELRGPLNAILGWTLLLRKGNLSAEALSHGLAVIERNVRAQTQIISDLLDISRITTGKLNLEMVVTDPAGCIEAAVEAVRFQAEARSLELKFHRERLRTQVLCDPVRLQQIVSNLLGNAIKFTPEGGRVAVQLRADESQVYIQISDTGKGISAELLPHVFERFRQAEDCTSKRLHGGLGLGLAITRHLVELHGGTITAESPGEGQGATFTVRLPQVKNPDAFAAEQDRTAASPMPQLIGLKCLVVDDDADARELAVKSLTRHGVTVKAVASARDALLCFQQWKPNVLISDIGLPGTDGYELIRDIRAWEAKNYEGHIPALALTGFVGKNDSERCFAADFQRHLPKPVEPDQLVRTILQLVEASGWHVIRAAPR